MSRNDIQLSDDNFTEIFKHFSPQWLSLCKQVCKHWYHMSAIAWNAYRERAKDFLYGRNETKQNWKRGVQMMRKLAERGDNYAMMFYGWYSTSLSGGCYNLERAKYFLNRSSHVCASFWLQRAHPDSTESNETFQKLLFEMDESDPHFAYTLAVVYETGFGCAADGDKYMQCLHRAIPHIGALAHLIDNYSSGTFVSQNSERTGLWKNILAEQGLHYGRWRY